MCLAIPGEIIDIDGDIATVDYGSEKRKAKIVDGKYSVGEYVIIQGKVVCDRVPDEQVKRWLKMFEEMDEDEA